ncbi:hypothetical protein GGR56DRAFT_663656 [Xylariaceae sp. FL0804]|nr:hypothetical protein GGR56DRAFT_663656 [Xylariaceae sp. FL0804]
MPHVGAAMERSLHGRSLWQAFADLLGRSAVAALGKRVPLDMGSIGGDLSDAKTAFSSWDNCMAATYCKWPVIAVIVVGALIILSIVTCIVRCCCCGVSCCCSCCHCLKCCGECCGLCDPPKGSRHKHLDEPYSASAIPRAPPPNQAYQSHAPMTPSYPQVSPHHDAAPQYAEFDMGGKKDPDALPAMPGWDDAGSKKVVLEEVSVEMEPLKKPEKSPYASPMDGADLSHANIPSPASPLDRAAYGQPIGSFSPNGYAAANVPAADPYGMHGQGYNQYDNGGYGQSPHNGMDPGYGMAGSPRGTTPHQDYSGGYGGHGFIDQGYPQYPQSRTPRPFNDDYGRSVTPGSTNPNNGYRALQTNNTGYNSSPRASPGPQPGYGYGNPRASPAGYGYDQPRASPGPQAGGYGYGNPPSRMASPGPGSGFAHAAARARSPGPPQRSQTQDSYRQYPQPPPQRSQTQDSYRQYHPPAPTREYSSDSTRPLVGRPSPGPSPDEGHFTTEGGFDFAAEGYSRPTTPAQAQVQGANTVGGGQGGQGGGASAYPGKRAYRPPGSG